MMSLALRELEGAEDSRWLSLQDKVQCQVTLREQEAGWKKQACSFDFVW